MSKRSVGETSMKNLNSEFEYDDSEHQLRKTIKLENQKIIERIKEVDQDIDISEHEVHKFLLIFHTLAETINSQEPREEIEGFVTDTIVQIVSIIARLLKNNIDNLNIPVVLKSALKKLKSFLYRQKTKKKVKQANLSQKMPRIQYRPRRPLRTAGMGQKNNDRIRVRNRRYKIKRFMLQPKNFDVKHNGRVVRRKVVRRQTIIQPFDVGENIKPYTNI